MQKSDKKIKVLFLCTGNSCRSQMAEGWTRFLHDDIIEAYSAGVETHGLNQIAVKVMAEAGVDISGYRSKHIDEFKDVDLDVVVTVCGHAHEHCPVFPGRTRVVHVGFEDPPRLAAEVDGEEEKLECYRAVRDEIKSYVLNFLEGLVLESVAATLKIYDPALCCSSGVCGPSVDDRLVALAGFLKGLDASQFKVERYNLAQQPAAYVDNKAVAATLKDKGTDALPLFYVDDELVWSGSYPPVEKLAELLNIDAVESSDSGSCCGNGGACGGGGDGGGCCS
ncbi:MAG: arsenite efflux transporter metallochaperone ArsD [Phycisphaerae bacterium]|nr:arsenite efflux transporter metallochaperone ArsD [Phycisphaerae bacterium]